MPSRSHLGPAIVLAAGILSAFPAAAQTGDLVGNWVYEGSNQELVIRSSIQQRSYSMPGDFSLGGGFPNTVISTTPTPTMVRREMALIVQADGDFSWITQKSYDESASCRVTVSQTKAGRITASGSNVTFDIQRGSERAGRSCNNQSSESDRSNRSETYRVTRSGSTLSVSDGTVTWRFRRYTG